MGVVGDRDHDHSGSRFIAASARSIYRAFLDPEAIPHWRAPSGMSCRVAEFEPRAGGRFRMELRYGGTEGGPGKSGENVDRLEGEFAELVPARRIVELIRFDSDDEAYSGRMRVTITLKPGPGGTEVRMVCDDVPSGISAADHRAGIASTLENLERYLVGAEAGKPSARRPASPHHTEDR